MHIGNQKSKGMTWPRTGRASGAASALRVVSSRPALKPNEAMFEAALERGANIGMIATFQPAKASMEAEFAEEARRVAPAARLSTQVVETAMTALRAGDAATHNHLVAKAAARMPAVDASCWRISRRPAPRRRSGRRRMCRC